MAIDIICRCGHDAALHETEDAGGGCQACFCPFTFGQAVISELIRVEQKPLRKERTTRRTNRIRGL